MNGSLDYINIKYFLDICCRHSFELKLKPFQATTAAFRRFVKDFRSLFFFVLCFFCALYRFCGFHCTNLNIKFNLNFCRCILINKDTNELRHMRNIQRALREIQETDIAPTDETNSSLKAYQTIKCKFKKNFKRIFIELTKNKSK